MNQQAPNPNGYSQQPQQGQPQYSQQPPQQQQYQQQPQQGQQQQYSQQPQGGYAPPSGHAQQQQGGYPQQGQQQQPPQEDLSNVRVGLAKGAPGRSNIDWEMWRNVPDQNSFNVPTTPDKAQGLPVGTWKAQVIWSKWQRKKQEWGGGLSLRLQLGFHAVIQGQTYPYKIWTSISQENADTMSEFAVAVCPNKIVGQDDFGPGDALGQWCQISIGYGTGNWAQQGKDPRIVVQRYAGEPSQKHAPAPTGPVGPAPQGYVPQQQQQQQGGYPQQGQQRQQQQYQQPPQQQQQYQQPPQQQYQQNQGGYGQTYGGTPQGGPRAQQGNAPELSDLPF